MAEVASYRNSLPLDSMLLEYRLESILGAGGFGITYLAFDTHLDKKVAIKEYLPVELAVRAHDGGVVPIHTGNEHDFNWGLQRFLQEARLLGKFSHPNIVLVRRYFEANGTAYMVMSYESGISFSQMLKGGGLPDEATLRSVLMPLLDGLRAVHEAGFLHRDIKPSNIFIRDNGVPLLLDFGAARLAITSSTRTMTSILTPGYAPLEQYSKGSSQGPWTDIYSLAAVMYRAITGESPPDVVGRLKTDPVMTSLLTAHGRHSEPFLRAIAHGMEVDEKMRPQTVEEWQAMLRGESPAPPVRPPAAAGDAADSQATGSRTLEADQPHSELVTRRGKTPSMSQLTWFAAGALALFLVIGGPQFLGGGAERDGPPSDQSAIPTRLPETRNGTARTLAPADFRALDLDGDGFLTPVEARVNPTVERDFAAIDTNGDGRISREEFTGYKW